MKQALIKGVRWKGRVFVPNYNIAPQYFRSGTSLWKKGDYHQNEGSQDISRTTPRRYNQVAGREAAEPLAKREHAHGYPTIILNHLVKARHLVLEIIRLHHPDSSVSPEISFRPA